VRIGDQSALEITQEFLRGGLSGGRLDSEQVIDLTNEDNEGNA
jgi:hypothetical protein